MLVPFHYVVKIKIIRSVKDGKIDFFELTERFTNKEPLIAREEAFRFYQNHVDILLEAKGKRYVSDKQAREELKSFYDPYENINVVFGGTELDISETFDWGIGVFMVIGDPNPKNQGGAVMGGVKLEWGEKRGDEKFIHGIGGFYHDRFERVIYNLELEADYYKFFKYDIADHIQKVLFFSKDEWEEGYGDSEPNYVYILPTPFDWTGYDKPFWWGDPKEENDKEDFSDDKVDSENDTTPLELKENWKRIIEEGESNQIEFKPSLLYNFRTKKPGVGVKAVIARTICGFLNSNGGILFIGVRDDGSVQGLDYDFGLAGEKKSEDFFLLEYDQMLKQFISFVHKSNIIGQFFVVEGKKIFVVKVFPSKTAPIFLNGQNGKEFYVRGEASTRKIDDIEEIVNYCMERWNK